MTARVQEYERSQGRRQQGFKPTEKISTQATLRSKIGGLSAMSDSLASHLGELAALKPKTERVRKMRAGR